jgi:hypothetical protein
MADYIFILKYKFRLISKLNSIALKLNKLNFTAE